MEHLPRYVVDWELDQAERGLAAFTAFLAAAGVKFEPGEELRKLLESMRAVKPTARFSPREVFEERLMVTANKSLEASGDARRLFREVGPVRRWLLLGPEELARAQAAGLKLERAGADLRRSLWGLATVPVALGTYVLASRLLRAQGMDENMAWAFALLAYFLVRVGLNRTLLRK